ncbi:unnamed protein product [Parnassius mnemosyne]|uniref:MADF domain-containing protein n=1 Tax=Parnassius mnemosyne TaxID=213953 RepID=A0AAV1L0V9_9NEOP
MASRELSDSEVTHLVELYQENEILWKVTHKSYRSREARDNAYARIRESLNTPSLSLQDISKKIKKLLSTYIKERKKIDASFQSGVSTQSVYKPKMPWFEIADGFLRTYTSKRHTNTNMDENFDCALTISDTGSDVTQTPTLTEGTFLSTSQHTTDFSDDSRNLTQKPKRKRNHVVGNKGNENSEDVIAVALEKLDNLRKEVGTMKEDEYDIFGKYIASSLRQMPKKHFISAKSIIQRTITQFELRILSEECTTSHTTSNYPVHEYFTPNYTTSTTMSTSSQSNIAVENIELNTSNDSISNVIGVLSNLEDSQTA